MKRTLFITFLVVFITFSITKVKAQNVPSLFLSIADSSCGNNAVGITLRTKNFRRIIDFAGALSWDSTILKYRGISFGNGAIILNPGDINQLRADSGYLPFVWYDTTLLGQTEVDSSIVLTLNFNIINPNINSTNINFHNLLNSTLEIDTIDLNGNFISIINTTFIGCTVNIIDSPTIIQNGNILLCQAGCAVDTSYNSYIWYGCSNRNFANAVIIGYGPTYIPIPGQYLYYFVAARYGSQVLPSAAAQIIMPVNLKTFTANSYERNVLVKWQTSSEINTVYYNVQRSNNGRDFTTVGNLLAKGAGNYAYSDLPIANLKENNFYYRLEIVDKDGTKTYSETKLVKINPAYLQIIISPNPARDHIMVTGNDIQQIKIVDNSGSIIRTYKIASNNYSNTLNIQGIAKGIYILQAYTLDGNQYTEKLLVN